MNDPQIRHRNRLRHHYTQTSNVLLFGYKGLSDGAKLTYQVIDSFDWENEAGLRKGYAYPSIARIAAARGANERTVQRHLAELEGAGLLEREIRPRQTNVLVINEPSAEEVERYLASLAGEKGDKNVTPEQAQTDGDKNVTLKKTKSPREENKPVNEEKPLTVQKGGPESLKAILNRHASTIRPTVIPGRGESYERREFMAHKMLTVLGDRQSLGYYRKVASKFPATVIFETLGKVMELARERAIRKNKGALFVTILSEYAHDGASPRWQEKAPRGTG